MKKQIAEIALTGAPWIHLKDAAVLFGMTYGSAQNMVYAGTFPVPTQRLGKHRIVFKAVIERYFKDQEKKALASMK